MKATEWNGSEELNRLRPRPHVSDIFESASFFLDSKFPRPHVSVFKSNSPVQVSDRYSDSLLYPEFLWKNWQRSMHLALP